MQIMMKHTCIQCNILFLYCDLCSIKCAVLSSCFFLLKHSISLHTVSQKHHFFDSGLLYQFCINFRRRRRLSELLNETESEEQECTTQQNQDDQAESPFTLRKTPPSEGNSNFSSGSKMTTHTKINHVCLDK